ncbi:hypothetical protein WA026_021531 [Henosepilachna vigintioctopunctata]|uniref:Uncharacterized protein n=1 Tax=Henosepilachna vigintioctopunctata TaxID=420089 RepID=A0AAW1VFX4_9CUCU
MWFCDGCKLYNSTGNPKVKETVLKKEIECLQRESTLSRKLLKGLEYTNCWCINQFIVKKKTCTESLWEQVFPCNMRDHVRTVVVNERF